MLNEPMVLLKVEYDLVVLRTLSKDELDLN